VTPPAARRTERSWTGYIVLVVAAVVLAGAGWWQTRPVEPPDPRPATEVSVLSDEHGCRIPRLWQVGEEVGGALLGSTRPDQPARVAWVPPEQVTRWQPDWTLREWCTR
jgi:hypothetical protein